MATLRAPVAVFVGLFLVSAHALAADISVLGGLTREHTLGPGERVEGKIVINNSGDKTRTLKIYQTDYLHYANGTSRYDEPGSAPRSNAGWITFTPQQLEVPPNDSASVFYTIQTPQRDELLGTYWSMLMVEPLTEDSPEVAGVDAEGKPAVAVRTVMRYGVQMVADIGTSGSRRAKFGDKTLVVDRGRRLLLVGVENTGERRMEPFVWAELYDEEGRSIGRFEGDRVRLYPSCSARFRVDVTGVPVGTYNTLIVADTGDDDVLGTQAKLEITQ